MPILIKINHTNPNIKPRVFVPSFIEQCSDIYFHNDDNGQYMIFSSEKGLPQNLADVPAFLKDNVAATCDKYINFKNASLIENIPTNAQLLYKDDVETDDEADTKFQNDVEEIVKSKKLEQGLRAWGTSYKNYGERIHGFRSCLRPIYYSNQVNAMADELKQRGYNVEKSNAKNGGDPVLDVQLPVRPKR